MAQSARRVLDAVLARVDADGSLAAVSATTNPMLALAYRFVPRVRDAPHGVGALLLAATEVSAL